MKKIILFILILLPINCYAHTFYTEYELIESQSENIYIESDLLKKEEYRVYHNYILKRANEYYSEHKKLETDIMDPNYYNETISYFGFYPNNNTGPNTTQLIKNYNYIRYFQLRGFSIDNVFIESIEILYENKPILYSFVDSSCTLNCSLNITSKIMIDLHDYYDLSKITLKINIYENTLKKITFMLDAIEYYNTSGSYYSYHDCELSRSNIREDYIIDFLPKEQFLNFLQNISWIKKNNYDYTYQAHYYKNIKKSYLFYQEEKYYYPFYTKETFDYFLDYDDYKVVYDYYRREKIEIVDTLHTIEDLENIISFSTIPVDEIEIYHDLTDFIDGEYPFKFVIKNNEFYKIIKVESLIDIPLESEPETIPEEKEVESLVESTNNQVIVVKKSVITKPKNKDTEEKVLLSNEVLSSKTIKKQKSKSYIIYLIVIFMYLMIGIIKLLLSKPFKKPVK